MLLKESFCGDRRRVCLRGDGGICLHCSNDKVAIKATLFQVPTEINERVYDQQCVIKTALARSSRSERRCEMIGEREVTAQRNLSRYRGSNRRRPRFLRHAQPLQHGISVADATRPAATPVSTRRGSVGEG